ncbi:helix-turn-helix domain-containing protein [Anaeromassilibacillus senegalensis]|uniref:Helix-turn-helix transcriptional regulator n=1 Tax=Anaeromassilibacillus senegalensis TaxID=1673717 RepID=A0ABS9CPR0_9FIRM|nr:helix-turn-helix transcriptional regulator [Anaeromassilibacillus senegalensis]MCF2653124.1 helix-turn-helix transcriptional regulator [Anaeromassilibacillus senegalensis]
MIFAEKLQRLRKEKGMSQEQLAAALMVSPRAFRC